MYSNMLTIQLCFSVTFSARNIRCICEIYIISPRKECFVVNCYLFWILIKSTRQLCDRSVCFERPTPVTGYAIRMREPMCCCPLQYNHCRVTSHVAKSTVNMRVGIARELYRFYIFQNGFWCTFQIWFSASLTAKPEGRFILFHSSVGDGFKGGFMYNRADVCMYLNLFLLNGLHIRRHTFTNFSLTHRMNQNAFILFLRNVKRNLAFTETTKYSGKLAPVSWPN